MPKTITTRQVYFTLILLGLVAYAPTLRVGFIWDDHVLIERNPSLREWSWTNVKHDFTSTVSNGYGDAGYLRPMVTWSNRMDYSLWGLKPLGYHVTSLLIHLANALLLYQLILILGCTPMTALLTASLFVVHPIDVEGLITVTGRATFLSFFFSLASLLFLAEPNLMSVIAGLCAFALALFSKEQSVIVPVLLVLVWIVRRAPAKRYRLLLPLTVILGLYLSYRHLIFGTLGAPPDYAYTLRFFMQAYPRVLSHYVGLILVPWNLHSHRLILHMTHLWYASLIGWVALALWSGIKRTSHPLIFFCVYWLGLGLLPPAMAMVHGGFMLDHWGYWVAPAVLLPLGIGFDRAWAKQSRPVYKAVAILFFPLLISYALLVHLNVELRGTDEKMYRWALHFTTSNPITYNLGMLLLDTGRAEEALPYLLEYHDAYPNDPDVLYAIASAYWKMGHPKSSMKVSNELLRHHPDYADRINALHAAYRR